jgi:hypothetical protein
MLIPWTKITVSMTDSAEAHAVVAPSLLRHVYRDWASGEKLSSVGAVKGGDESAEGCDIGQPPKRMRLAV